MTPVRVLFVCTGNTCRSFMAERIANLRFGEAFAASSAGFQPQPPADAENAMWTLKKLFDIEASDHVPRDVRMVDVTTFDLAVAMDKQVASRFSEAFPNFPTDRLIAWRISDPYGDDLTEYARCSRSILRELSALVPNDEPNH